MRIYYFILNKKVKILQTNTICDVTEGTCTSVNDTFSHESGPLGTLVVCLFFCPLSTLWEARSVLAAGCKQRAKRRCSREIRRVSLVTNGGKLQSVLIKSKQRSQNGLSATYPISLFATRRHKSPKWVPIKQTFQVPPQRPHCKEGNNKKTNKKKPQKNKLSLRRDPCKVLGRQRTIAFEWADFRLSTRGFCKLEVISNICLETNWHINKRKWGESTNNNKCIDHPPAGALAGGENSQWPSRK